MVSRFGRSAVAVIVLALIIAAVSAPVTAIPPKQTSENAGEFQDADVSIQSSENNSTSHHVNPANTSGEGDLLQVRGWLTGRLSTQLGESAIKINQREYEAGRNLIGDQYDSRLGQLVDIVGETETESDDGFGDAFGDVQQTQRNYSEAAQEYEETYEAYQEAVQNGNETEARRHARRLQEIEGRLQQLNETLVDQYEALENQTGADFTQAVTAITNHSENISTQQAQIEEDLFTETTLHVTSDSETISYKDPLVARGQLRTEDGTPLSDQEVTLQVHTRTRQVETDDDGRFTFRYRPRTIHANASVLSIQYIPENESVYLSSNATLPVEIEPVEANLTVRSVPSSASFGDRLAVSSVLTLDGDPVTGIPVEASVGTYRVGDRQTNESGATTVSGTVPASLAPGQQQVLISLAHQNRAVQAANTTAETTIRSTETSLIVQGEREDTTSIRISGRLQTEHGTPVPAQTVRLELNETIERSVETDSNGRYSLILDRSELPATTEDSVNLTATFDGQGTNLNSTVLSKQIEFTPFGQNQSGSLGTNEAGENNGGSPEPQDGENRWIPVGENNDGFVNLEDDGSRWILLGVLAVIMVFIGGVVIAFRRYYSSDGESLIEGEQSQETSVEREAADDVLDWASLQSLIADERPEVAIHYAYHHVRDSLANSIDVQESDTHWEFFNKCREANIDRAQLTALQDLIEAYEQVQFHEQQGIDLDLRALLERIDTDRN